MAPARVTAIEGDTCLVETGGRLDRASTLLAEDLRVGDWVLVESGIVVRQLDPEQAEAMSEAFRLLFSDPEGVEAPA
jgi:hydrogenase assembly chaperone HypC/HupF